MKILVTGQITDDQIEHVDKQLKKQTYQDFSEVFLVDHEPAKGINNRRQRIAQNHEKLHTLVDKNKKKYNYIIQLEGDSVLEPDCFTRLIARLDEVPAKDFGYVSGVEVGRHGLYCIGAWEFADDRRSFKSIDPKVKGLHEVDATGFYCLLAPTKVWLKGNCFWNEHKWGPDVNWGLSLRDQGYKIYADMDIEVGHQSDRGVIGLKNKNLCQAVFKINEHGKWRYKVND